MRVIALPQLLHGGDQLAHLLPGGPSIQTRRQAFIFKAVSPARHAQIQPAIHDDIGHRRLSGQPDRMPEGRDHRPRPQPHIPRAPRQIDEVQQRVRRDGEVHAMMLTRPDGVHPALIGHVAQLNHLIIKPPLVLVGGHALHMHKE